MHLLAVPAFADNYIWTLHDGRQAWVVDPGDSAPVVDVLEAHGLELSGILVTHHHADHVGGVRALQALGAVTTFGPAGEAHRIAAPFEPVRDGDRISLGPWHFRVMEVPGHTAGHIAYVQCDAMGSTESLQRPVLFCGDTLFSAGCGRLFEGTPAQMHAALSRFAALPADTQVCCTHEYTLSNLRFARAVEPHNGATAAHEALCRTWREQGRPTLPSTIATERAINPFMRTMEAAVIDSARQQGAASEGPVEVLAALRAWKDHFR
jgi:hydroxyacylglutathione hydrolase